jgi:hypothetical protein
VSGNKGLESDEIDRNREGETSLSPEREGDEIEVRQ